MQSVVEIKFSSNDTRNVQKQCFQVSINVQAWWAAVYGVAQSWTRLKRLSSSGAEKFSELSDGHITMEIILIFIPHRLSINLKLMVRVGTLQKPRSYCILHVFGNYVLRTLYYEKSPKYAKIGYYNESPMLIAQIQSFLASCYICFIYTLLPSF